MKAFSQFGRAYRSESASLGLGDRLCDWMVFGLASWTLACHAVVGFGGGLRTLVLLGIGLLGLAVAARYALRSGTWAAAEANATPAAGQTARSAPPPLLSLRLRVGGVSAALGVVAAGSFGLDYRVVWGLAVALLAFALSRLWSPAEPIAAVQRAGWRTTTWLLAALGALFPLFLHRHSDDDAYYVNVAAAAVDLPSQALLRYDTLHGIADLAIMSPVHRLSSYELLAAAVSYLSPLTAIQASHWVLPALLGGFVVLAYSRLLRLLTPEAWLASLLVVLAVFVSVAETRFFYSNFAFVRLHQGKCVFVSIMIPLLIVYGVRFASRPSPRSWLLLAAAQVAGLGVTGSAIWLAPATAGLALAAGLSLDRRTLRTLGVGLLASAYPLIQGLLLRAEQTRSFATSKNFPGAEELLRFDSAQMLGEGPLALICWIAVLCAWCFARSPLSSRLCVVFALGFLLVLYNPFAAILLADSVTGHATHYRAFWVLPLPAFLALIATAPLALHASWASAPVRIGACVMLSGAFILFAPSMYLLSVDNRVRFEPLGLKVPTGEYEIARIIAEHAPAGSWVLAPEAVSLWVVTFQEHPYPLMTRKLYFELMKGGLSPGERSWREVLTEYVGGWRQLVGGQAHIRQAIARFDFAAVGLAHSAWSRGIARTLAAAGYREQHSDEVYAVWVREGRPAARARR